jgi:hypothetical protein
MRRTTIPSATGSAHFVAPREAEAREPGGERLDRGCAAYGGSQSTNRGDRDLDRREERRRGLLEAHRPRSARRGLLAELGQAADA